jgi:hypothetical protein
MGNTHSSTLDSPPPYSELPPEKQISKFIKLKLSAKQVWKRISNEETWKRIGKRVLKVLLCIAKIIGKTLLVVLVVAACAGCILLVAKCEKGSPNPGAATGLVTGMVFPSVLDMIMTETPKGGEGRPADKNEPKKAEYEMNKNSRKSKDF